MSMHPLLAMMPGSRRRRRPHGLTADDFGPPAVPGLMLWWAADEAYTDISFSTKATTDEDSVGALRDKSENGNHGVLVPRAGDPPYLQDDPNYLGTSVKMINHSFAVENVAGLTGKNKYTVISVRRVYSSGSGTFGEDQWFQILGSSNGNLMYMSKDMSTARIFSGIYAGATGQSRFGATPGSPSLIVEVYTFDGSRAATERLGYRFGAAPRTPLTATPPTAVPFDSVPGNVNIGMGSLRRNSGTTNLDFHELLVYDRLINEDDLELLINTLYSERGYVAPGPTASSPPFTFGTVEGQWQYNRTTLAFNYGESSVCPPGYLGLHVTVGAGVNSIGAPTAEGWTSLGRTGAFVAVKMYIDTSYCTSRRYPDSLPHVAVGTVPITQSAPLSGVLFSQPMRMLQPFGTYGGGVSTTADTNSTADRTIPTFTCVQPGRLIVLVFTLSQNSSAFSTALSAKGISIEGELVTIPPPGSDYESFGLYTYSKLCAKDEVIPEIVVPDVYATFRVQTMFFYC